MESFQKFIDAQEATYDMALQEIKSGKKKGHWMWYIFPQMSGLGSSDISEYYALHSVDEARKYLENKILGPRLIQISSELLKIDHDEIEEIMGFVDSLKLQSSMTLFHLADPDNPIFQQVLDKYYLGEEDQNTLELCSSFIHKK